MMVRNREKIFEGGNQKKSGKRKEVIQWKQTTEMRRGSRKRQGWKSERR